MISNHTDLERETAGVRGPLPSRAGARGRQGGRRAAELELLSGARELLVLARYMQILSGALPRAYRGARDQHPPLFLPAFAGADPTAALSRGGRGRRRRTRAGTSDGC